ncbi:MAG TPA: chromophore lyase CpcT/CpeT [Phycisphaerales bacterium]|nr:chromophore lyase CpcT/CpeT [Phycisphaerales bacterium]
MKVIWLLVAALAGLSGCSALSKGAGPRSEFAILQSFMSGSFSSQTQAAEDPEFRDIRLHMEPIWDARTTRTQRWLYVEQSAAESMDKPYRQRVYRLIDTRGGTYRSEVYELPGDPLTFAGAWAEPSRFDVLTPEQLVAREGCTVVLRRVPAKEPVFEGGTEGSGCVSTLRGAAYATSKVWIGVPGLRTWDQGFDASGAQVWGATKGPYVFRRVD